MLYTLEHVTQIQTFYNTDIETRFLNGVCC